MSALGFAIATYLAIGVATAVLWLAVEVAIVAAKRRAGQYPMLKPWDYPLGVFAMLACWPWWWLDVLRVARGRR